MRKIYVSDFTLNKLAGERKNPLLFREKTAVAASVDAMGADAIELAPIAKVKEDTIVYKTIAANVRNAALCLPAGETDGIDGFRLDMAHFINDRTFWDEALAELRRRHPRLANPCRAQSLYRIS